MKYEFEIGFRPETLEEKEEFAKQEICDSTDATPGLSEAITGMTWKQIFKLLGYDL